MKFKFLTTALALLGFNSLLGSETPSTNIQTEPKKCVKYNRCENNRAFEVKGGYFLPYNKISQHVYHAGGFDVILAYREPICENWSGYFDLGYTRMSGRSLNFHQHTVLQMATISAGLEAVTRMYYNLFKLYATIGPRYFFVMQHNSSSFVDKNVNNNNIGGFVNAGIRFEPIERFIFDIWVDNSYCRIKFHPHETFVYSEGKIQVGGFSVGAGFGYSF